MKTILYLAVSANGHITLGEDGTDWVSAQTLNDFAELNKECGIVVMGKRTFEMFGKDFPQKDCLNIVMTKDQNLLQKNIEGALFTNMTPLQIVEFAKEKGFSKLFLVGGTQTNTGFLKDGLIDEIWINIHPLIIGTGKNLFSETTDISLTNLRLIDNLSLPDGFVKLRYEILK